MYQSFNYPKPIFAGNGKFRVSVRIPSNQKFLVQCDRSLPLQEFIHRKIVLPFNLDPDDFVIKAELPHPESGSVQPILDPRDLPYLVKELTGMRVIAIE
jgi:hypothetical protein